VRALVRRAEPALALPGVEVLLGDATDPAALNAAVAGVDVVFHLAGVRRAAERDEFFRVNVGSTRLLLDACVAQAPGLRRFVLAGSRAASPPSATGCREEEPLRPSEAYGESKAEAERVAWQYRDRLPVSVARPPRIMGPGDRENLLFFTLAAKGWALRFGEDPPLSWIDVDDAARGLLVLAEFAAAVGQAVFVGSEYRTTVEWLFLAAAPRPGARAGALGRRCRRRPHHPGHRAEAPPQPEAGAATPRAGLGLRPGQGPGAARLHRHHPPGRVDRPGRRLVPGPGLALSPPAACGRRSHGPGSACGCGIG
jgi:nucleoside-diphosphate-sugar epimerase